MGVAHLALYHTGNNGEEVEMFPNCGLPLKSLLSESSSPKCVVHGSKYHLVYLAFTLSPAIAPHIFLPVF